MKNLVRAALIAALALTLPAAAAAAPPPAGGESAPPPEPTVAELLARAEPCQDLECAPLAALIKRGPAVWPEITAGLESPLEMTRFWALGVLSEMRVPAAWPKLHDMLAHDPLVRVRAAAAFALGNQRARAVVPWLAEALGDSDVNVRFEAASALSRSPGEEAVEPLLKALRDDDEDVRGAVVEALTASGDRRAIAPLERWGLGDRKPRVRGLAAIALGTLGATSAAPKLMKRLSLERDPEAKAAVAWALGELRVEAAREELRRLAEAGEGPVKELAAEALKKLGPAPTPAPKPATP